MSLDASYNTVEVLYTSTSGRGDQFLFIRSPVVNKLECWCKRKQHSTYAGGELSHPLVSTQAGLGCPIHELRGCPLVSSTCVFLNSQ